MTFVYDRYGNMTCQVNGSTSGLCPQYSFNTSTNQISNTGYVYGGTGHLINDGTHTYHLTPAPPAPRVQSREIGMMQQLGILPAPNATS